MEKCQQQSPLVWVNPLRFSSKNPSERRVSRCILRCGWNALNIVSWQAAVLVCGMFGNYIFKHAHCCRGTLATNLLRSRCSAPRWGGGSSAPPAPAETAAHTPGAGWTKPAGKSAQLDMQTFNQRTERPVSLELQDKSAQPLQCSISFSLCDLPVEISNMQPAIIFCNGITVNVVAGNSFCKLIF